MKNRMNFSVSSTPIMSILNSIKTVQFGGLDLQPEYQRGYIWKEDFKDKLIYSIIRAYPIGNISVRVLGDNDSNKKGAKSEVVDGQQRLTTIRDFIDGEYIIKSEWSRKIIEEIKSYFGDIQDTKLDKLLKKLNNKGKIHLKYSDLPEVIQGNINTYNISMSYIANSSEVQIREYFRFLQNQERLRAGEIINSIPETNLEKYLDMIIDKDKLLDIIGFADDRREFDKIFYSIIGMFDGKIPLGTADKNIQKYVTEAEEPIEGVVYVNNMIDNLNNISNLDNIVIEGTRKRFLKYLLLLSGFNYVDFSVECERKIKRLYEIDNKLSAFFSAKANIEDEVFEGYNKSVRDDLRHIALLSKGGHSFERVKNRMQMLKHYINNNNLTQQSSDITPIEIQN